MELKLHQKWLRYCLMRGAEGCGYVGAGIMVGSVLVRDDQLIAEGIHLAFGKFHAERNLLLNYTEPISEADTLYVNLEPCVSNPTKKTPGCVDIIIERGVRRVVYGMLDVDPRIAGRGISFLKSKGVTVEGPYLHKESHDFNRGFVSLRTRGRPWITLLDDEAKLQIFAQGAAWVASGDNHFYAALLIDESALENASFMNHILGLRSATHRPLLILLTSSGNTLFERFKILRSSFRVLQVTDSALQSWDDPDQQASLETSPGTSLPAVLGTPRGGFAGVASLLAVGTPALHQLLTKNNWVDSRLV